MARASAEPSFALAGAGAEVRGGVRIAAAGVLVLLACSAPAAQADFGIANWEALTCKVDATPADPCTAEDVSDFYTQAAGHPNFGITAFELNTGPFEVPEGNVKDIRV
ncbi:MAG TPA: hypothetical protein VFT10_08355, partial [Solirubrobacterales bacterium]|nr:hypothetical protein [Solirubrobacterales bacterium]